ncbi:MAG TPA: hypothetical protein P5534_20700, partial [Candidatus Paceibacterota bacterium]|nr:hypothetical protein [Candidatus Paceibacterota bacterium]
GPVAWPSRVGVAGAWSLVMNREKRTAGFLARHPGMWLAEVVWQVGMKYQAAPRAVKRFERTLTDLIDLRRSLANHFTLLARIPPSSPTEK